MLWGSVVAVRLVNLLLLNPVRLLRPPADFFLNVHAPKGIIYVFHSSGLLRLSKLEQPNLFNDILDTLFHGTK